MAVSYLEAIREGFTTTMAVVAPGGDAFVYDDIEWTGGDAIPSQDDLDDWIKLHPGFDPNKALTKYQFRQLFTMTERVNTDNFMSSPLIPANYKAILYTMFKDLEVSAIVYLDNPQTMQGVGLLVSLGFITSERAAQILANQPAPV